MYIYMSPAPLLNQQKVPRHVRSLEKLQHPSASSLLYKGFHFAETLLTEPVFRSFLDRSFDHWSHNSSMSERREREMSTIDCGAC
jgi:hypothetical protein